MKVRHVDLYPDEFLAGIANLSREEIGVYLVICLLIYSSGRAIDAQDERLIRIGSGNRRGLARIVAGLAGKGKVSTTDGLLMVRRCAKELAKSSQRIGKHWAKFPETSVKDSADIIQIQGARGGTNHQPTNHQPSTKRKDSRAMHDLEGFEIWYRAYPRHEARGNAERAYRKALKLSDSPTLLLGAQRYARECRGKEPGFIAHPATWLNGQRWLDEAPLLLTAERRDLI